MREAVLLFDQSQFPRGDGTAHDPNLQHSCGSRRCQKLFVLLKDFQMMTWPALWMVATAQTRRRVSGDLRTVFSLAVIAQGNPQKELCAEHCSPPWQGQNGTATEPRAKFLASVVTPVASRWRCLVLILWRLCSSSCHQGRWDLCLPCHLEGTCTGICSHLPFTTRPPISATRGKSSNNRISCSQGSTALNIKSSHIKS